MKILFSLLAFLVASVLIAQSLNNIESVEYDHAHQRFLVSNSNSIIAMSHPDLELSFFGSGQASFGMEVMDNKLFVIQNGIRAYDLDTEEEVMNYSIPGSGFLNGMASDGEGRLWVTDFSNDRIYEVDVTDLEDPSHQIVVSNTVSTPNGIVYDDENDRLVFVSWGANAPIKEVTLPFYGVNTVTETNLGFCDGIDNDGFNDFFISSWSPTRISRFEPTFLETPEIIEAPGIDSPADICYAIEIDTLAIPNSGNSTVTFVDLGSALSTDFSSIANTRLEIFGNPISDQSFLRFSLVNTSSVQLTIRDLNGRLVKTLVEGDRSAGEYTVLFYGLELEQGIYLSTLEIDGQKTSLRILVP